MDDSLTGTALVVHTILSHPVGPRCDCCELTCFLCPKLEHMRKNKLAMP